MAQLVLNVDDQASVRYVRTRLLRQAGFEVREAATGADALRQASEDRPQLILLDINLPDIDGLEVCRIIKAEPGTALIPVLQISATFHDPNAMAAGLNSGADAYLTEPVEPEVLIATARALLRVRAMHDALQREMARREQAEQKLFRSEQRLRLAQQAAAIGTWDWDIEAGSATCSDGYYQLYGVPPQEFETPETWLERVHPEDRARMRAATAHMTSGATRDWEGEFRIVRPDGSVRWLSSRGQVILNDSGRPVRMLGATTDITERKRKTIALEESEERLRLAMDAALMQMWDWDLRSKEITGYEVFGLPHGAAVVAEDRQQVRRAKLRSLESGQTYETQFRALLPDGGIHWYASRGRVYRDEAGRPVRMIGATRDITAQKQAEQELRRTEARLQRLSDANIIGILVADDERITEANGYFLDMVGYTREELSAGKIRWCEMTPPEYAHLDERALEELISAGWCTPFEKEIFRKDGSRVPVLLGASLLENAQRRESICFVLDLSERWEFERHLVETQKLESIGLLAGGIAHDFNNLLTGMLGGASLALDMVPVGHPARPMLEMIVSSADRAADLTAKLLAYSGKGRFVLEPVHLSTVVEECAGLLRGSLADSVRLRLDLDPQIPFVHGDAGQLRQLVMNLMINAVEALAQQPGDVTVRTGCQEVAPGERRELPAGSYVRLTVEDTGGGMDENTKARMFEPFFTTKFTGRGLGLSAVQGIVRGHKGAIQVTSAPGQGTQFTVLLPVAPREVDDASATVLVVDDEDVVRQATRVMLEAYGYRVLAAADGQQAIEQVRQAPANIAAVVLDWTMPGMGGPQVAEVMRTLRADLPIIVFTGHNASDAARQFAGLGVAAFVQKPFTTATLIEQVRLALRDFEERT